MTLGAFGVILALSTPERPVETVDDLAGLFWSRPWPAVALILCLFSLAGVPPLAGFWGKFWIFASAWSSPPPANLPSYQLLAVIGVLNAAVGAYYYLRIVVKMVLWPEAAPAAVPPRLADRRGRRRLRGVVARVRHLSPAHRPGRAPGRRRGDRAARALARRDPHGGPPDDSPLIAPREVPRPDCGAAGCRSLPRPAPAVGPGRRPSHATDRPPARGGTMPGRLVGRPRVRPPRIPRPVCPPMTL
jgi:hypothetical protein